MSENEKDAEAIQFDKGPNREEMAHSYLPESDDWDAKTVLDLSDPSRVAALKQLGTMYPEVNDLQPLIDEFLDDFLKTRTSVKGKSREEYQSILISMFGGNVDEETARNAVVDAFAGQLGDED